MRAVIQNENYGEIIYEESFWTGKKNIFINEKLLEKTSKTTFITEDGKKVILSGNYLMGVKATIESDTIQLTPSVKWYEIALSILPFIFVMIWGNIPSTVNILPIVSGMIGGAISGLFSIINLFIIKGIKGFPLKLFVSILIFGLTVLVCYLIAIIILSLV